MPVIAAVADSILIGKLGLVGPLESTEFRIPHPHKPGCSALSVSIPITVFSPRAEFSSIAAFIRRNFPANFRQDPLVARTTYAENWIYDYSWRVCGERHITPLSGGRVPQSHEELHVLKFCGTSPDIHHRDGPSPEGGGIVADPANNPDVKFRPVGGYEGLRSEFRLVGCRSRGCGSGGYALSALLPLPLPRLPKPLGGAPQRPGEDRHGRAGCCRHQGIVPFDEKKDVEDESREDVIVGAVFLFGIIILIAYAIIQDQADERKYKVYRESDHTDENGSRPPRT